MLLDNVWWSPARRSADRASRWRPSGVLARHTSPTDHATQQPPADTSEVGDAAGSQHRKGIRGFLRGRRDRDGKHDAISREFMCLEPATPIDRDHAAALVDAVIEWVSRSEPRPLVVVLALHHTPEMDDTTCEAVLDLHHKLDAHGVRLCIGGLQQPVVQRLASTGVMKKLGPDGAWASLQTAMLAAYAHLNGPGVVTRRVMAALQAQVVQLDF